MDFTKQSILFYMHHINIYIPAKSFNHQKTQNPILSNPEIDYTHEKIENKLLIEFESTRSNNSSGTSTLAPKAIVHGRRTCKIDSN